MSVGYVQGCPDIKNLAVLQILKTQLLSIGEELPYKLIQEFPIPDSLTHNLEGRMDH